jgi:hypothetical protein
MKRKILVKYDIIRNSIVIVDGISWTENPTGNKYISNALTPISPIYNRLVSQRFL